MSQQSNGFYVTLPSDGSHLDYPNNTNSHYVTRLHRPLELRGGGWEVALVDIHFPYDWVNVKATSLIFSYRSPEPIMGIPDMRVALEKLLDLAPPASQAGAIFRLGPDPANIYVSPAPHELMYTLEPDDNKELIKLLEDMAAIWLPEVWLLDKFDILRRRVLLPASVPNSYADSPEDLLNYLPQQMMYLQRRLMYIKDEVKLECTYERSANRVLVNATVAGQPLKMWIISHDHTLFEYLGLTPCATHAFAHPEFYIYKVPSEGTQAPKVNRLERFVVQTDIIDHQSAGDAEARQLATVPLTRRQGPRAYWKAAEPFYVPISKNTIDTIEIKLCTEQGDTLMFADSQSKVLVRLHIRPRLV